MINIIYNSQGSLTTRHDGWNDMTDEAWSIWDQADWSSYEYTMGDTDYTIVFPVSGITQICLRGTTNLAIHYRITGCVVLILLGSSIVFCAMGRSDLSVKFRIARYDDRLTFVPKRGCHLSGTPPPKYSNNVFWGGGLLVCIGRSATLRATTTRISFKTRLASRAFVFREVT